MIKYILQIAALIVFMVIAVFAYAKYADLAGSWYPASPEVLKSDIEKYLQKAKIAKLDGRALGVIAPHAALDYSGPVAAYAYKALSENPPQTVIVVGFTHKKYFPERISVFTDEYFTTPLGKARIDLDLSKKLMEYDKNIQSIPEAFDSENSVEMQIPFIQTSLKDASLVLVALCDQRQAPIRLLANALSHVLRDRKDFVIIASTDLAHYADYKLGQKQDEETIGVIKRNDAALLYQESLKQSHKLMCGIGALCAVMDACKRLGAQDVEVLRYANSADSGGADKGVGYLSAAFVKRDR